MDARRVTIVTDAAPRHRWPTDLNVETPQRVLSVEAALRAQGYHSCTPPPSLHARTHDAIRALHTPEYLRALQAACATVPEGDAHVLADPEEPAEYTYVTLHSYDDAVRAVSTCLHAADAVAGTPTSPWFVAVRPPGHHALAGQASGFCLLGNVAIMVKYLQSAHGVQRVCDGRAVWVMRRMHPNLNPNKTR